MAFPQVATSSSGGTTSNATAHTVTLPTGIASGDLLIVLFSQDGTGTASVTTPASGWSATALGMNETALTMLLRVADGGEASTITVTTSDSQCTAWTAYRITGADTGTTPEFPTRVAENTSTPDPPSVTASWGSDDNLFIALVGWDANWTITSYPANYTANQLSQSSGNITHGACIASATREVASATEDPGTFTIGASDGCVSTTIVIQPAGAAPDVGSGSAHTPGAQVEGAGAFVPLYDGTGEALSSAPQVEGTGAFTPVAEHPVVKITQRSYGLSGPRYGSFAGKNVVADDGTGAIQVPAPQLEGAGAFATPSYIGAGEILVSPPQFEGTGALAFPNYDGTGDIQVSPPQVEGTGAFATASYAGSGEIQVSAPQVEGTGAITFPSYDGTANIQAGPPQLEGLGSFAAPGVESGSGDIRLTGPQVEGIGAFAQVDIGTGEILGSAPQVEGIGAISFPSDTGSGDIQTSAPQVEGAGSFAAPGVDVGAGDIQVSPPQVEGLGVYTDSPLAGYPQIMGTPICEVGASSITHVITLPTGIQVGELIVVFFTYDINGTVATVTTPASGWTEAYAITTPFHFTEIFYRRADGTEAATITATLTNAQPAAWTAYRIANVHLTQPFHVHTATTYGFTTTIDVPPSTVPWGAEKTLWMSLGSWEGSPVLSTYPTNHPDQRITCAGGVAGSMGIFTAARYDEIGTEDPDAFTISSTTQVAGSVVAFRTAGEGVPTFAGDGTFTLSPVEADATGEWSIEYLATADLTLPSLEATADGLYFDAGAGAADLDLPAVIGDGVGAYFAPGTAELPLPAVLIDATGVYAPLVVVEVCPTSADIDTGPLVPCLSPGGPLSANTCPGPLAANRDC